MLLIAGIIGFSFGFWITHIWGNHRAKYYKNRLIMIIKKTEKINQVNKVLGNHINKLHKMAWNQNWEQMQSGVIDAIISMNNDKVIKF